MGAFARVVQPRLHGVHVDLGVLSCPKSTRS